MQVPKGPFKLSYGNYFQNVIYQINKNYINLLIKIGNEYLKAFSFRTFWTFFTSIFFLKHPVDRMQHFHSDLS